MHTHRFVAPATRPALSAVFLGLCALASACGSNAGAVPTEGDSGADGGMCTPPTLADDNYSGCATCTFSSTATPDSCSAAASASRPVDACCAWVATPPTSGVARASGLHYNSSSDPTVDLGCLTTPPTAQPSTMVTLTGYVKIFGGGEQDSAGVKIEIFQESPNHDGSLGPSVGTYTTTMSDPPYIDSWQTTCSPSCNLRTWADLYDYNIYISDPTMFGTDDPNCMVGGAAPNTTPPCYNVNAVPSTEINAVAASAIGTSINPSQGVLAGEVHDCGDIRLSGATVDTDQPHEAQMFYFNTDESDPLPDLEAAATSDLSLFGAININAGVPTRLSATGYYNGQLTLLGTYVVQMFPGAVTALSFRGRRPYQTSP
jgi:hypothetical protein